MPTYLTSRLPYFVLIAASLLVAALRPFEGSLLALALVVLGQLYLPGWLLARVFGKLAAPHPITRFAWVLAGGIGLVTVLGGALRLMQVNVTIYIVLLHGLMLFLALLPADSTPDPEKRWRLTWANAPLYGLLLLASLVVLGVSVERSSIRFNGYEDQTVFVSLADWLANDPDEPGLRSRRAGVSIGDARFDTDGWTYAQAAWVRSSGRPAADVLWYDMPLLFAWATPLVLFALGYSATRRESAGVFTAALTVVAGLVILDSLVYTPSMLAFGQYSVFQYNTLRTFSRVIVLPLALFVTLEYLRQPRGRDLLLVLLLGVAIALFHPLQIMVYGIAAGGGALVWWLVQPRRRLRHALALGGVMLLMLVVPLAQRSAIYIDTDKVAVKVEEAVIGSGGRSRHAGALLPVEDVPLLGDSYIVNPEAFFYHPLIVLAVALGLVMIVAVRRSLAAQFIFGATAVVLVLLFTPGLTPLFARLTYVAALSSMVFVLPVGLAFGVSFDWLVGRLRRGGNWIGAAGVAAVILLLVFEPVPIPASVRDQLYASEQMQIGRDIHASDDVLLATIAASVDTSQRTVWLSPTARANYIIESIPHTLITGGRAGTGNLLSNRGTGRFLDERRPLQPFLDSTDLDFIETYGVTHFAIPADVTRLPLLHLQPERFAFITRAAGYDLFAWVGETQPDAVDALFEAMNTAYAGKRQHRWQPGVFNLILPGDPSVWQPFAEQWAALLAEDDDNDRARHGLAFSLMLAGADAEALPHWRTLHERHPDLSLYTLALAYTQHILGDAPAGFDVLWQRLERSENPAEQVLMAHTLLTDPFFYLLDAARMDAVLQVVADHPVVWDQLVLLDDVEETRRLAALMLLAGRWSQAVTWLDRLPDLSRSPQDLVAMAAAWLAQGNVDAALAVLAPALDADWRAAKAFYHPDRWQVNEAAQVYYLLQGEIAARDGRTADAEAAYQQAIAYGAETAGAYFLAALRGEPVSDERALVSLLAIADSGQIYVADPVIMHDAEEDELHVSAVYGDIAPFAAPYPIESWRLQVIDAASGTTYALLDAPAGFASGALVRAQHSLTIDVDVPPLTNALVSVQPRHDNAVTATTLFVPMTLNRPDGVDLPADAVAVGCRFGDAIMLEAYTVTDGDITLYWQADAPPAHAYQVFVHVLGADGEMIDQIDRTPVDGRYPTDQWRPDTRIADTYNFAALPDDYRLRVGLYTLPDMVRLPVTAAPAGDGVVLECVS